MKHALITSEQKKRRYPFVSFLLSLAAAGLGQMYNGAFLKGLAFFFMRLALLLLIPFTVLIKNSQSYIATFFTLSAAALLVSLASPAEALAASLREREAPVKIYTSFLFYCAYGFITTLATCAALCTVLLFFQIERVRGGSALPSLEAGEYALVKTYGTGVYSAGDLVRTDKKIARIIAGPESKVQFLHGAFRVNDIPRKYGMCDADMTARFPEDLQQFLITEKIAEREYPVAMDLVKQKNLSFSFTVPAGCYLVADDNRLAAVNAWIVKGDDLKGRIEGVIIPLSVRRLLLKPFIEQ